MLIGYRRLAGKVRLGTEETGTRGAWWEKRRALFAALKARGHDLVLVAGPAPCDVLLIEFGSSNARFYEKDLRASRAAIELHEGPVVYVCDDPDLPLPAWPCRSRVQLWRNCTEAFGPQPIQRDVSFGALLPVAEMKHSERDELVYTGRPDGGRGKKLMELREAGVPVIVAGRPEEWTEYRGVPVEPAPPQPLRHPYLARFRAALCLADAKHKRLGWRTGRAHHALAAGTPVLAE